MSKALLDHVQVQNKAPVHAAIIAMANHIRQQHQGVQAVLAYGSALRDSNPENTLMDFYVLTQGGVGVSNHTLSRALCMRIPPNVYYAEMQTNALAYRCKYAVLPMELLAEKLKPTTANPYFWVRFAQPMRIIWTADDHALKRITQLLVRAMETAVAHAQALAPNAVPFEQWTELFRNTYRTELRPESASRAGMIVEAQKQHFNMVSQHAKPVEPSPTSWGSRRWQGKFLSILRLAKAAFTFQGGADYAAWKIKRHSGVDIEIKDWHRHHPLLASVVLLPKLLRKGGLK